MWSLFRVPLVFLLFTGASVVGSLSFGGENEGRCVMYDTCDLSRVEKLPLYCLADRSPVHYEPENTFVKSVLDFCGSDFIDPNTEGFCCSPSQFTGMTSNLGKLESMVSCKACLQNFKALFCHITCSPRQSQFTDVLSTYKDDKTGRLVVNKINYYMSQEFADGFFKSCKDLSFAMSNQNLWHFAYGFFVLKDAQSLLDRLGLPEERNGRSPYEMVYKLSSEESVPSVANPSQMMRPMNGSFKSCKDPDYLCPCVDCHETCAPPEPWPIDYEVCYLFKSVKCVAFGAVVIYLILLIGIAMCFVFLRVLNYLGKKSSNRRINSPADQIADVEEALQIGGAGENSDVERPPPYDAILVEGQSIKYQEYWFNNYVHLVFYKLGKFVGSYPVSVTFFSILCVAIAAASFQWNTFSIETNPERLWVSPNSQALAEKRYFDENFGPFWRTVMVIISSESVPVVTKDNIQKLFDIQRQVSAFQVPYNDTRTGVVRNVSLSDICYNPLGSRCTIQTATDAWEDERSFQRDNQWKSTLELCLLNPTNGACVFPNRVPLMPDTLIGGVPKKEGVPEYLNAKALILTFLINNSVNATETVPAAAWEVAMIKYLKELQANETTYKISFNTESSLEIELNRESRANAIAIAISYLVMLAYVTVALGKWSVHNGRFEISPRKILTESRFMLGLAGIFIVIGSLVISVAFFTALKVKPTLIIAEVIPFLVLAIGVDNIFILISTFDHCKPSLPVNERIAITLGKAGPSIILCGITETVTFLLGGLVEMPAVKSFALYAAVAIFVDCILQVTCFMSLLALDSYRLEGNRVDCFPCIKFESEEEDEEHQVVIDEEDEAEVVKQSPNNQQEVIADENSPLLLSGNNVPAEVTDVDRKKYEGGLLHSFMKNYYSPFLLSDSVRIIVLICFVVSLAMGVFNLFYLEVGLDQRVALPLDSYLIGFFNDFSRFFAVGPPLYFVVRGVDFSTVDGQYVIASKLWKDVNPYSLGAEIESNRQFNYSYIASSTSIWLDDFYTFLLNCDDSYLPPEELSINNTVTGAAFSKHLKAFLSLSPGIDCPVGGLIYQSNLVMQGSNVVASNYRTYHSVLEQPGDYIKAMRAAKAMAKIIGERNVNKQTGKPLDIYAYSLFYIFFEQYESIAMVAVSLLSLAVICIFLLTLLFLGNFIITIIIVMSIVSILIHLAGFMALWEVNINALSVVNLVIAAGISIEFSSHISRSYFVCSGTSGNNVNGSVNALNAANLTTLINGNNRKERVFQALNDTGAAIFSGITLTKIIGVSILTLAPSQIFHIYYFRMYLLMILIGFVHGLVYLPVILSFIGPRTVLKSGRNLPFSEGTEE